MNSSKLLVITLLTGFSFFSLRGAHSSSLQALMDGGNAPQVHNSFTISTPSQPQQPTAPAAPSYMPADAAAIEALLKGQKEQREHDEQLTQQEHERYQKELEVYQKHAAETFKTLTKIATIPVAGVFFYRVGKGARTLIPEEARAVIGLIGAVRAIQVIAQPLTQENALTPYSPFSPAINNIALVGGAAWITSMLIDGFKPGSLTLPLTEGLLDVLAVEAGFKGVQKIVKSYSRTTE